MKIELKNKNQFRSIEVKGTKGIGKTYFIMKLINRLFRPKNVYFLDSIESKDSNPFYFNFKEKYQEVIGKNNEKIKLHYSNQLEFKKNSLVIYYENNEYPCHNWRSDILPKIKKLPIVFLVFTNDKDKEDFEFKFDISINLNNSFESLYLGDKKEMKCPNCNSNSGLEFQGEMVGKIKQTNEGLRIKAICYDCDILFEYVFQPVKVTKIGKARNDNHRKLLER